MRRDERSSRTKKVSHQNRFDLKQKLCPKTLRGSSFRFLFFFLSFPIHLRLTTSFSFVRGDVVVAFPSKFPWTRYRVILETFLGLPSSGSIKTRAEWTAGHSIFSRCLAGRELDLTGTRQELSLLFSSPRPVPPHPRSFSIISGSQPPFLSLTSCF